MSTITASTSEATAVPEVGSVAVLLCGGTWRKGAEYTLELLQTDLGHF